MSVLTTGTTTGGLATAHLPTVTLDELTSRAGLQTRVDRTYLVPCDRLALLDDLGGGVRVLRVDGRTDFRYESVYLDTPARLSYLGAAHGRRRRLKVRTRRYLDSGAGAVEVKTRGPRGVTVKTRLPCGADEDPRPLVVPALDAAGVELPPGAVLAPALTTRYRRTTLLLPGPDGSAPARVTVDTDLAWSLPADGPTTDPARLVGLAVVETKTGSTPCAADRLLWRAGHRPVRFSKFATGLATLDPDLPATRWRRTLDRWVLPAIDGA